MAGDDGVDAVIVVTVPTAIADLTQALATASVAKPLVAVVLDQQPVVRLIPVADDSAGQHAGGRDRRGAGLPAGGRAVPAYAYPEGAARALGRAVAYRAWRERQRGQVPALSGLRTADARAQITEFLKGTPAGGWLPPAAVSDLLACYQIPLVPTRPAADEGGVEVLVGVVQEPVFGPLVVFGLGGAATDVLGDHAAKLTPLTDTDADDLIHAVRAAPLLFGHRGTAPVDAAALADVLLRVSRLADELHEVAELELNPVIATPEGVHAVGARIRISPAQPRDPFLRRLR